MRTRCRRTCPYRGRRSAGPRCENHHLALAARCARLVSADRAGARGAGRPARRRRRPVAAAADRCLSARHLPLVLPRTADAVVVARSARRAVPGGVPAARAAWRRRCATAAFSASAGPRFRGGHRWLRGPAPGKSWHLDHARDARCLCAAAPPAATPTASRSGAPVAWSAGSTGCAWAACSSASRCSAAQRDASKVALAHLVAACRAQQHRRDRLPAGLAPPREPRRPHHPAAAVPGPARRARSARPRPLLHGAPDDSAAGG